MVGYLTPEDRAIVFAGLEPMALRREIARRILNAILAAAGRGGAPLSDIQSAPDYTHFLLFRMEGGWEGYWALAGAPSAVDRIGAGRERLLRAAAQASLDVSQLIGASVRLHPADAGAVSSVAGWVGVQAGAGDDAVAVLLPPAPAPGESDWRAVTSALAAGLGKPALFRGEVRTSQLPSTLQAFPLRRVRKGQAPGSADHFAPAPEAALVLSEEAARALTLDGEAMRAAQGIAAALSQAAGMAVEALPPSSLTEAVARNPAFDQWLLVRWHVPDIGEILLVLPAALRPEWTGCTEATGQETARVGSTVLPAGQKQPALRDPAWDKVRHIPVTLRVLLGRAQKSIDEILRLRPGDLIELDRFYDEPHEIYVGDVLIGYGETRVVEEREGTHFGIAITSLRPGERRKRR